jgi:hypothetical protein
MITGLNFGFLCTCKENIHFAFREKWWSGHSGQFGYTGERLGLGLCG